MKTLLGLILLSLANQANANRTPLPYEIEIRVERDTVRGFQEDREVFMRVIENGKLPEGLPGEGFIYWEKGGINDTFEILVWSDKSREAKILEVARRTLTGVIKTASTEKPDGFLFTDQARFPKRRGEPKVAPKAPSLPNTRLIAKNKSALQLRPAALASEDMIPEVGLKELLNTKVQMALGFLLALFTALAIYFRKRLFSHK